MNFQILDADYFREEDRPVVRLFGRSDDGKSVCCLVPGFEPYFYLSASGDLQKLGQTIKERFDVVKDTEVVERFEPIGYQERKQPMLKVTTFDPRNVPEIRDEVAGMLGVREIYETDILFRNRFLIDKGFKGMGWVSTETDEDVPKGDLLCDHVIRSSELTEVDRIANSPLKYMAFDIECLPHDGGMPTPDVSPIIMVSFAFEPAYKGHSTIVLVKKEVEGVSDDVEMFTEEADLLNRFFEIITDYDPDVITGYNINDFDVPYIVDRVNTLNESGAGIKPIVGRDSRNLSYRKIISRTMVSIPGRVVVDVLPLIRQQFSLKRYTLRNVSKELLDREKLDVAPADMEEHWNDSGEKICKFIDYARRDSELALELLLELKLLDKYIALSRVSGILLQDTVSGGQTNMVEHMLMTEFGKQGRVMSTKPDDETSAFRRKQNENLKGGAVLEPEKGLHENVIVMDYKSLYPTIMMAHNLCYTTVVKPGTYPEEDIIRSPSKGEFVKPEIFKGVVPSVLEHLLDQRTKTKQLMKKASDEGEYRVLDATQLALKILLNSFYGYSGYARARLYSLQMANSVTSIGRGNIARTEDIVCNKIGSIILRDNVAYLKDEIGDTREDDKIVKLSVAYGDTDSVFVHCKNDCDEEFAEDEFSLEDSALVGRKVASIVTASLPDPMELEFEAAAKRVLLIAKKRYAQWIFEPTNDGWKDSIKVKGLETVRRDWCELTSKMLNRVLELVLKEGDIDGSVRHVRELVDRVRNLDVQKDADIVEDLVLTKSFSKSPSSYKNKQPHLTVVENIQRRTGVRPAIGERIPFVITAGKGLFVDRAEDPEYVREHNITLDVDYYIQKQMLPPVERILGVFGVDMATLNHDSKQKGLFDFDTSPEEKVETVKRKCRGSEAPAQPADQKTQSSLFDF
ncbi:DNA-directed DNA polymerase [Methanococcoides methylutens]|uniref:DNA-directed DNA polymerase n=1 Tax=Methanococcoides methylutens TaxID=2226 RepID=UPI0040447B8D